MKKPALLPLLMISCTPILVGAAPAGDQPTIRKTPLGRIEISSVPIDPERAVRSGTYTPSGKVLVDYGAERNGDNRAMSLATMDDDGRNFRPFFSGMIPVRPKDNGVRLMVFPDNRRIFIGDFVLECATSLEACEKPALLPVTYPEQMADGPHIAHRWSEMIVAPDNRHIAWTTLLSNYSAMVSTGELKREGAGYRIVDTRIVSTLDPFVTDPKHSDGVLPRPVLGGEVKQFVAGGTAISMVGASRRDLPDSVVQYLAQGRREAITDTPGYTETTIFSPDERLGATMTTRFSEKTDPAVLGLMPRPYPDSLNMGLSMFAYTYAVTGVRQDRPGNIGPALIDIARSKSQDGYMGVDLSTDPEWVFRSPLSWHPSGKTVMWVEGRRGGGPVRLRIARLPDYKPGKPVAARVTPTDTPGGISDLSRVLSYARTNNSIDVKVYGRRSGYLTYKRTPQGTSEKRYFGFSDDGRSTYTGQETMAANPNGRSTYTADITLKGARPGRMDLTITFGPLAGRLPAGIVFDKDASGTPLSHGYASYAGKRLEVSSLVP